MKRNQSTTIRCAIVAFLTLSCLEGFARNWRVAQVPNGQQIGCALCHLSPTGRGPRNEFGEAVNLVVGFGSRADFWDAALAELDSDGDGFTNGEEVGDPDGDGVPTPGSIVTHPGDAERKPEPPAASVEPVEPNPEVDEPLAPTEPIVISGISVSDGLASLAWTGGRGPFIVQQKALIDDDVWVDLAASSVRNASMSTIGEFGFFRVTDLGNGVVAALTSLPPGQHEAPDPAD
jgi:hypothetical protein